MEFTARDRRLEGDTPLRRCQLTQLYLLDVFVEICDKYGLQYWLDSGTLIGAMRHNGFIPWDDDLDVGMPIKDYKKFLMIAKTELPEGVLLQTPKTIPGAAGPTARLRDRYSFYCEPDTNVKLPCGIFIDIFSYVDFPKLPLQITRTLVQWCFGSWMSEYVYRTRPHGSIMGMVLSTCKAFAWRILYIASQCCFRFAVLCSPKVLKFSPEMGWGYYPGFDKNVIFPLKTHEFEGRMYSIPHRTDEFLTVKYGDWRTPPPESERKGHHHSIILATQAPKAPWALPYPYAKG